MPMTHSIFSANPFLIVVISSGQFAQNLPQQFAVGSRRFQVSRQLDLRFVTAGREPDVKRN